MGNATQKALSNQPGYKIISYKQRNYTGLLATSTIH
jgi:hypothetical protein